MTELVDHNTGVTMVRALAGYLEKRRRAARRFFADLWKSSDYVVATQHHREQPAHFVLRSMAMGAVALVLTGSTPRTAEAREQQFVENAHTESARQLVDQARAAAQASKNQEAKRLFEAAIAHDPSLRPSVLRELADQLTYSGEPRRAVALYREVLETNPARDEAVRARLGLALALSWDDQQCDAKHEYEQVLRLSPENAEAVRGLARVQSWRGKHRAAQELLSRRLKAAPDDAEAARLLAQAQWWMGRSDRALATLKGHPVDEDSKRLLDELRFGHRPQTQLGGGWWQQPDGLTRFDYRASQTVAIASGRGAFVAGYELRRYQPKDPTQFGIGELAEHRPLLGGRFRFDDDWEANANVLLQLVQARQLERTGTDVLYDTWVTWWPGDSVRFDLGSRRESFDDLRSLAAKILSTSASLSTDWTPNELWRVTVRGRVSGLSDGNWRRAVESEVERRVLPTPRLRLGLRHTTVDFAEERDAGYFSPDIYHSVSGTFAASGEGTAAFTWRFGASAGVEWVAGDRKPIWSGELGLRWRPIRDLQVEPSLSHFSSRIASPNGFARTSASLTVAYVW